MAFVDSTKGRTMLGIDAGEELAIKDGVSVKAGDLLGYSSGWCLADANAGIRAQFVAGTACEGNGVTKIRGHKLAWVGFEDGTEGTEGADLYLSDTAGSYADSPGAEPQRVGVLATKQRGAIDLTGSGAFTISHNLTIASSACADIFFIATRQVRVTKVSWVHATAAGAAATVTIERLQGTEEVAAGDDLLGSTKIDANAAANTVQTPALTSTAANLVLAVGDRLAIKKASGTNLGSLANACISVELEPA